MPGKVGTAKLDADLPIDPCRHPDGEMRPPWQIAIPPGPAGIKGLGKIQKPACRSGHIARQHAVRRPCRSTDFGRACMADPVTGNIAPVHAGILENVAGDVCELHGDAEIDGMRP